jgi:hypothetical protein
VANHARLNPILIQIFKFDLVLTLGAIKLKEIFFIVENERLKGMAVRAFK